MSIYKIGDIVTCKFEPAYWDSRENRENPEGLDEDILLPEEEHPGFNEDMYHMVSHKEEYEITEIHPHVPWLKINGWWWHEEWLSAPKPGIKLTQADEVSKYKAVIIKIKKMEAARERKGHVF